MDKERGRAKRRCYSLDSVVNDMRENGLWGGGVKLTNELHAIS